MTGIRVYVIRENLEDVAVEYIQSETTQIALREYFRRAHPTQMQHLEDTTSGRTLHFLEQYDPNDETSDIAVSQPHAFVADQVITIAAGGNGRREGISSLNTGPAEDTGTVTDSSPINPQPGVSTTPRHEPAALSLNLDEALSRAQKVSDNAEAAFAELRDTIAGGEKIGWWIVYNGDPERYFNEDDFDVFDDQDDVQNSSELQTVETEEDGTRTPTQSALYQHHMLNQPTPSLLPDGLVSMESRNIHQDRNQDSTSPDDIGTAIPHPPPHQEASIDPTDDKSPRPKGSRTFVNPLSLRKKSSKSNMQPQKEETATDTSKLREGSKKEGFRQKLFGRSNDKK